MADEPLEIAEDRPAECEGPHHHRCDAERRSKQDRRQGAVWRNSSCDPRWYLEDFARGDLPEFWDLRNWTFGSNTSGNLMETWVLIWTVTHSGSTRYGEAAVPGPSLSKASSSSSSSRPVRWLQANITGACNNSRWCTERSLSRNG